MRLSGRRILVTGAGSGIGFATAELFLREGARVVAVDRDEAALERAGALLSSRDELLTIAADVTDEAQVGEAVNRASGRFDGLDGVVNAAGIDLQRSFCDTSIHDWQRVMAVNLLGPVLVCHAALPAMHRSGGGTIVNIASGAGLRPLEKRTAYCSSKAALVMFSKALAIDLGASNIRVNAVCPGIIDTPMFRASFESSPDPQAELARIMDRFVIKRVGSPESVAYTTLFLTSSESDHITGSAVAVDGGRAFH